MGKGSFWKDLFRSFKPGFYQEAAFRPAGEAVKYLLLLSLIVSVIIDSHTAFIFKSKALAYLKNNKDTIGKTAKELAVPITIKKGKVKAEVKQPYIKTIKKLKSKEIVFAIDTTGKVNSLDKNQEGILLTKDTLISQMIRRGTIDIKKYDLSSIKDFSIKPSNKEDEYFIASSGKHTYHVTYGQLKKWAGLLFKIGWPVLLVFGYIFTLAAKFIQVLAFSIILLILNLISVRKFSYANIFNVGVFTMTPPTVLATIYSLSGLNFRQFNLIYIIIYIAYLALGYSSAKGNKHEIELDEEGEDNA